MLEPVAHGDAIATAQQQIVDGLLDLEDVDVDPQLRIAAPDPLDRARHHHLRNAGHGADAQFGQIAASDLGDDLGEIIHLLVDAVDLLEDVAGFRRREIAPVLALEEADAQGLLGVFHQPADAGRRYVEKPRRAADRASYHHGADHLDLAKRHHVRSLASRVAFLRYDCSYTSKNTVSLSPCRWISKR